MIIVEIYLFIFCAVYEILTNKGEVATAKHYLYIWFDIWVNMPEKIHSFTKDKQCHGEGKLILSKTILFS